MVHAASIGSISEPVHSHTSVTRRTASQSPAAAFLIPRLIPPVRSRTLPEIIDVNTAEIKENPSPGPAELTCGRQPGVSAILALLAGAILLAVPAIGGADDWPQWLGPQRDGIWRETGILEKFPTNGPPVRWRREISAD